MIAIVTGSADKVRVHQVLDAAVERLGLSHIVMRGYDGAAVEAAAWALAKGLKWTIAPDPMDMHPAAVFSFPGGEKFDSVKIYEISA